tara:strand:+ start:2419 stop:3180 length:762 start_codon:yes stop_codon:yes gene_type:complete
MICPICKTEMREGVWDWMSKNFTPQENLDCHRCDNCNHIFVDYQEDGLDFHKNDWRKKQKGGVNFDSSFHLFREGIVERRSEVVREYTEGKNCKSLIDVGAGGGSFLLKLKQRWWDIPLKNLEAQEISTHCINYLNGEGFKTHQGDFNEIEFKKQYDVVTAWHVLEHVKDVKTFAKQIDKITKKYFIVEVPMASGSNGGYGRNPNTHEKGFNGHFHFFTEESMKYLFKDYFKSSTVGEAIQGGKHSLQMIFEK